MTTYVYTNSETGKSITVYSAGESGARQKFAEACRTFVNLKANEVINSIRSEVQDNGKWIEARDSGSRCEATGHRISVLVKKGAKAAVKFADEPRGKDDLRIKAEFERQGLRGW